MTTAAPRPSRSVQSSAHFDDVAADPYDAYLRLHLLSHRLVAPYGLTPAACLEVLTNVVWTNHGPLRHRRFRGGIAGAAAPPPDRPDCVWRRQVWMVDYVVPTGVRISPMPTACGWALTWRHRDA